MMATGRVRFGWSIWAPKTETRTWNPNPPRNPIRVRIHTQNRNPRISETRRIIRNPIFFYKPAIAFPSFQQITNSQKWTAELRLLQHSNIPATKMSSNKKWTATFKHSSKTPRQQSWDYYKPFRLLQKSNTRVLDRVHSKFNTSLVQYKSTSIVQTTNSRPLNK